MPETHVANQKLAPKSLLRHRPLETQREEGEARTSPVFHPTVQRASRPSHLEPTARIPAGPRPSASKGVRHTTSTYGHKAVSHVRFAVSSLHPLLLLGLGMLTMLLLWMLVSTVVGWAGTTLDDLHYGRPRTFQADAYVDHNERPGHPSHFIVVNLNRHIDIIELQGSDPAHMHIYVGPTLTGPDADLTPATLRFDSVAGQRYPNMLLLVGPSQVLYLNKGGSFVASSS